MISCKNDGQKGCNDKPNLLVDHIGPISYHLGSLLSATELTTLNIIFSVNFDTLNTNAYTKYH